MSTNEIPKEKLLLKFLNMTTSSADVEALLAIRKANDLLTSAGWSWSMLLDSRITIVEDPFKNLSTPHGSKASVAPSAPPPPPTPTYRGRGAYHPPINSRDVNKFNGDCYSCGIHIPINCGFVFNPSNFNSKAPASLPPICDLCNSNVRLFVSAKAYSSAIYSSRSAGKADYCYCCGNYGPSYIFDPSDYKKHAPQGRFPICSVCNSTPGLQISSCAAPRKPVPPQRSKSRSRNYYNKPAPNISDL